MPELARSTPLPATGPAPVPALEALPHNALCMPFWAPCGTQYMQPMLWNMALNAHAQNLHLLHASEHNAHAALLALANGTHTRRAHTHNVLALDTNMFAPMPSFAPVPAPASATTPAPTTAALVAAHSEGNYFVEFAECTTSTHRDFGCLLNFCCSVLALCGPGPDQRKPDLHPERPQPPTQLPATCAPTMSPGPASALQNADHCNTLAKHIVLCLPACLHMPGCDNSRVLPLPVQTPAIHGLRVSPVPHPSATALPPASAPWASHANTAPCCNLFCMHHHCLRATTTPTWRLSHCC
jgi:hypothetical protein